MAAEPARGWVFARARAPLVAVAPTANTLVRKVRGVGKNLASQMRRVTTPGAPARGRSPTLQQIFDYVAGPPRHGMARITEQDVSARLGLLCQNRRPNQCVPGRGGRFYHTRDTNKRCLQELSAVLAELLRTGGLAPPAPLGPDPWFHMLRSAHDRVRTRAPAAAVCGCFDRAACDDPARGGVAGCTWRNAECKPADNLLTGFEGLPPYSGQRLPTNPERAYVMRGSYANEEPRWRRAGGLPPVRPADVASAFRSVAMAPRHGRRRPGKTPFVVVPEAVAGRPRLVRKTARQ